MAGDGEGMVDAAEAGMLDDDPLVVYSASYAEDPAALRAMLAKSPTLVVTDSNRDRARRWSTLTETSGYTEGPGTHPLTRDESDARLDLFPDEGPGAQTVTVLEGAKRVAANDYANAITYTPEDRPTQAFDGNVHTAWRTGQFDDVRGDRIRIVLDHPITTDHVNLVQVLDAPNDRYITRALVRFDGGAEQSVDLGPESRTAAGQTVTFPTRRFRSFEIEVQDTNVGEQQVFGGLSPVGFAEIRLRDDAAGSRPVRVREVVRMPTDLLRVAGTASARRPLVLLMNRDRVLPVPARKDPEAALVRRVSLPTARQFAVAGQLRLSRLRSDPQIDRTLGYTGPVVANVVGAPRGRTVGPGVVGARPRPHDRVGDAVPERGGLVDRRAHRRHPHDRPPRPRSRRRRSALRPDRHHREQPGRGASEGPPRSAGGLRHARTPRCRSPPGSRRSRARSCG